MTVMAFDSNRRTNAQAIADAHELGYINDDEVVLDLTYESVAARAKVDMVQKHAAGNVSTLQIYRKAR
jgi:hypothetical protein